MAALRRNFGDVSLTGEAAGLQLVWYLPPGVPNATRVTAPRIKRAKILMQRGVHWHIRIAAFRLWRTCSCSMPAKAAWPPPRG